MDTISVTETAPDSWVNGDSPLLVELGGEFFDLADPASRDRLRASRLATSDVGISIISVDISYEDVSR